MNSIVVRLAAVRGLPRERKKLVQEWVESVLGGDVVINGNEHSLVFRIQANKKSIEMLRSAMYKEEAKYFYYGIFPPQKGAYMDDCIIGQSFQTQEIQQAEFKGRHIPLGPFPSQLQAATKKIVNSYMSAIFFKMEK